MIRRVSFADGIAVMGIGIICLPVFLSLFPNIESSRSEARLSLAYDEVRRHHQSLPNADDRESVIMPKDLDPWGQPYRVVSLDGGEVRVLSAGPNMSFSPTGLDCDDIYSDMPVSPFDVVVAKKRRQALIATGASLGLWIVLGTVYLRRR